MELVMRHANRDDAKVISDILTEAAGWQKKNGHPAWQLDTLSEEKIVPHLELFFLAEVAGEAAGTFRFQIEDKLFWPDQLEDDAAYLHKVAVRRKFAGGKISQSMLAWAVEHARTLRKKYLRLDCDAVSPGLRAVYEDFGFTYHSDKLIHPDNKQLGSFLVARYQYKI